MNTQTVEQAQELVEQWRGEFVGAMEAMGDFRPEMKVQFEPPTRGTNMLWWSQPMDLAPGAGIWIGTAEETWSALGGRILTAAGIDSSSPSETKDTYLEVLRQSLGGLARTVSSRVGREVTTTTGSEQEPGAGMAFGCQVTVNTGAEELPLLAVYISQEMLRALENCTNQDAADALLAEPAPGTKEQGAEVSARACGTLDLLLDVEMPVSVSFGRTQVRVQNILKLITGSIIELDRSISEPVEVIVNNCTIARGEVVVVDGNYGVRINEVMSRKERLQESRKYLLPASTNRR